MPAGSMSSRSPWTPKPAAKIFLCPGCSVAHLVGSRNRLIARRAVLLTDCQSRSRRDNLCTVDAQIASALRSKIFGDPA